MLAEEIESWQVHEREIEGRLVGDQAWSAADINNTQWCETNHVMLIRGVFMDASKSVLAKGFPGDRIYIIIAMSVWILADGIQIFNWKDGT